MNLPILQGKMAFGVAPDVPRPAYTDVSDAALEFRCRRGRSNERSQTDPGTAQALLSNKDRRFDPANAASPFAPNVVPMVKTQWSAAVVPPGSDGSFSPVSSTNVETNGGAETNTTGWTLVNGTLTRDTTVSKFGVASFKLVSSGAVQMTFLESSVGYAASAGQTWTVSAWVLWPNGQPGSLQINWKDGGGTDLAATTGGFVGTGAWQRVAVSGVAPASTATIRLQLSNQAPLVSMTGWVDGVQIEQRADETPFINTDGAAASRQLFTLFTGHVENWPLQWEGPTWQRTDPVATDSFAALQQALVTGSFPQQTTGARIAAVLAAVSWPTSAPAGTGWTLDTSALGTTTTLGASSALTNIATGYSTVQAVTITDDQPRAALDLILEAAQAEPGLFYIAGDGTAVFEDRRVRYTRTVAATFSDVPAVGTVQYEDMTPDYNVSKVVNDVKATATIGGTAVTASAYDSGSISRYFRRSETLNVPLTSAADLQDRASFELLLYSDPFVRFDQVTVRPQGQPDVWATVLALELGSKVTVTRTPATGAAIPRTCFVEAIEHTVTRDDWTVLFQLSPGEFYNDAWQLDSDALDTTTTLIY